MLPISSVTHENLRFYMFERQMSPLTKFEAKECLCDLLTQAIGYAHLDVRLPNICFSINHNVKLIDLDQVVSIRSGSVGSYIRDLIHTLAGIITSSTNQPK